MTLPITSNRFSRRTGITLLELLIAIAGTALVVAATSRALASALKTQPQLQAKQDEEQQQLQFEDRVSQYLRHAWLSANATDTASFFTTNADSESTSNTSGGVISQSTSSSDSTASNAFGGSGASSLTFTANGIAPNAAILSPTATSQTSDSSSDVSDFETANQNYGPQGGVIEVGLSLTAVGDPQGQTGLFLRIQRPADGDSSQGGTESLLLKDIDLVTFEFYDGQEWQPSWDTSTMTTQRLPAAVRVTYGMSDGTQHAFVVPIPASDATSTNPVQVATQ